MALVLIVDDDASITTSLALLLKQAGHASMAAAGPREALSLLEREGIALVLQDMNFSRQTTGAEGLALLADIKARRPHLPVVLMTAWGSIGLAVQGVKAGAADFVTKPWTNAQLLQSIETALGLHDAHAARSHTVPTREELDTAFDFSAIVGSDPRLLEVLEVVTRVAPTDASVLVTGESGTGKELVADALHRNSRRREGPFVKVNLGGVPSTLFEGEMFGHLKGAFTDARSDRKGRFELATGGTIFLDEIGELEPGSQVKMLRVLQDRTYEPLGSSVTRTVDVRVVSATNRDLPALVARGDFREDLLYRLNLIVLHVPPLRERPGDVPALAHHFLAAAAQVYGRVRTTISPKALRWLQAQPWPGNARQLKQLVERTLLMTDRAVLEAEDFARPGEMAGRAAPRDALPPPGSMTIDEIEKGMIVKCLAHYEGNLSRVAEALGLSRPALYRRLEKHGIAPLSLRFKIAVYLVALHAVLASLLFAWLRGRGPWLLAGEAGLALSILVGAHFFRALFGPLELVRMGAQFIAERDFSSRLREVGQPELDALVAVYNRMIDSLREERLRAQEQHHFLEEVVRASPAGILTFDFDGRLTTANPGAERLLARPAAELLGLRLDELGAPFIGRVAELTPGDSLVLPLQGSRRVRWMKTRFLDRGFPRTLLVVEELTEELRRSERAAYEKIIRTLSHEINNSIAAAASLVESGLHYKSQVRPEDRPDFETALSVANTRLRHLNAFVRGYADVVRLPQPHLTACDLGRLVRDVAHLFRPECEERGIDLVVDVQGPPEPVPLDEHQMEQVLVNVVRNAVEACSRDGRVALRTCSEAGRPVLVVEDSGSGIPPEVQASLFTPFFTTKENGRGIGLTLAQEILTQHGFGFTLESRSGEPTRFAIRF